MSRIYVASSWRNRYQSDVVAALRREGHEVYDFKTASWSADVRDGGFSWADIDPNWQKWMPEQFRAALNHPIARNGFRADRDAMVRADQFCLVLPSGRSAHLEAGWAMGCGKPCSVFIPEPVEPELMYILGEGDENEILLPWIHTMICTTTDEVLAFHRGF